MQEKIKRLRELKLLFVEDEEDLVEIITDTLSKLDVDFLTATNGKEALDLIEEHKDIDIIITDINMPVMNGIDMVIELKNRGNNTSIVVMSAHTEKDYIEKAKMLGIDDYLFKPFDFIKFIDLITTMEINK